MNKIQKPEIAALDFEAAWHPHALSKVHSQISNYAAILEMWMKVFSEHKVKVLISEQFFANAESVTNEVFSFLGIPQFRSLDLSPVVPYQSGESKILGLSLRREIEHFYRENILAFESQTGICTRWLDDPA